MTGVCSAHVEYDIDCNACNAMIPEEVITARNAYKFIAKKFDEVQTGSGASDLAAIYSSLGGLIELAMEQHDELAQLREDAARYEWLKRNSSELDYWAVMQTGRHDIDAAVDQFRKAKQKQEEST